METNEKLKSFDDQKLIDIVRNYRQYGYSEDIRNAAISILESRGIDLDVLQLKGGLVNSTYDAAKQEYDAFESASKFALVFYVLMLTFRILTSLAKDNEGLQLVFVILFWLSFITYIIFLIKSFINQSQYYKLIGKKDNQLIPALYFTFGVLLYVVMYFVFRKQIRSEMNEIR